MMKMVVKVLVGLLSTKAVREVLLHCAEELAKRTPNTFDDQAVATVKDLAAKIEAL